VFYKAVGEEGENIDYSYEMPIYEIILGDRVVKLPGLYFLFWEALKLKGKEHVDVAQKGFSEVAFSEEFNEIVDILTSEGVVVLEE